MPAVWGLRPKSSTHLTHSWRKRLAEVPRALQAPPAESIDLRHRPALRDPSLSEPGRRDRRHSLFHLFSSGDTCALVLCRTPGCGVAQRDP
jgi:hypothetical protein